MAATAHARAPSAASIDRPASPRARTAPGEGLRFLHPAYFALVMATGILGIACKLLGFEPLPRLPFAINVPAYVILWLLTVARAAKYRREFRADFGSHQRAPEFFTAVAATAALGMQFAVHRQAPGVAFALWCARSHCGQGSRTSSSPRSR